MWTDYVFWKTPTLQAVCFLFQCNLQFQTAFSQAEFCLEYIQNQMFDKFRSLTNLATEWESLAGTMNMWKTQLIKQKILDKQHSGKTDWL